jgi:tRNA(fMet)-specific endonuclease VapC
MVNLTISIPDDLCEKMKRHSEVKWSEVVRKALVVYVDRLEIVDGGIIPMKKMAQKLKALGFDASKVDLDKAIKYVEFPKALEFNQLSLIYPSIEDYQESLEISLALLQKGTPLPAMDILVAAMCIRRNLTLSTKDNHFTAIKSIKTDFKLTITK